jgi:NADPH:quinone reductase-like Zn-dependent oxidoreductase
MAGLGIPVKAIVCERYGDVDVVEYREVATPEPRDDQVLVEVHAAALNDFDLGLIRGRPVIVRLFNGAFRPKVRIPGCDVAGTVVRAGRAASRFAPGDTVFGDLSGCGFGAFAEYVCVPESALVAMPANASFAEAAALPQAVVLAMQGLFECGVPGVGDRVLLNGAGGGVGTFALQIAMRHGAEVTCVDSSDKLGLLAGLGADHVIDYAVADFTRRGPYDLILDTKTNRSPGAYLRALAPGGAYVTVGGSMRRIAQMLAAAPFARRSGKRLHMVTLVANRGLEQARDWLAERSVLPVLDSSWPLEQTAGALRHFAEARHRGKVIVEVRAERS